MAAHAARGFWTYIAAARLSGAQLFLDVIGAFGSLVREIVFGDMGNDVEVARILQSHGFGPELMHTIAAEARAAFLLPAAGVPEYLTALLKEVHMDLWHTTQGLQDPTATCVGSKPGGALGSIIFDMLATSVTNEIEKEVQTQGLMFKLPVMTGI